MTAPDRVTPEDLDRIPVEYRRTIARWLAQRAAQVGPGAAKWVGEQHVTGHVSALRGVAVDLAEPLEEGCSLLFQAEVLDDLLGGGV